MSFFISLIELVVKYVRRHIFYKEFCFNCNERCTGIFGLLFFSLIFWGCTPVKDDRINDAIATLENVRSMVDEGNIPADDSLLVKPLDVFMSYNIDSCLAEAYYLRGKILSEYYYLLRASDCYAAAIDVIKSLYADGVDYEMSLKYDRLLFNIYLEQSKIARMNMFVNASESCLNKAERLLPVINNDLYYSNFLVEKALCSSLDNDFIKAKQCLKRAVSLQLDDKSMLYRHLSEVSIKVNEFDSAVYFINKSLVSENRPALTHKLKLLKGIAFSKLNMADSAVFYIESNIANVPIDNKVDGYRALFEMYDRIDKDNISMNYMKKYVAVLDTLKTGRREVLIQKIRSIHEYKIQKERANLAEVEAASNKLVAYRIIFGALLLMLGFMIYVYINILKKRKLQEDLERESYMKIHEALKRKEAEIALSHKQEELRLQEIDKLNKSLGYYKQLNNITLPIIMSRKNAQGALHLTDDDWNIIVSNADACFNGFSNRLREYCPLLTDDDIRFCCLVKMELPMSSLSEIYHIAKASISRKKMRLKEKMKIENSSFDEFISVF